MSHHGAMLDDGPLRCGALHEGNHNQTCQTTFGGLSLKHDWRAAQSEDGRGIPMWTAASRKLILIALLSGSAAANGARLEAKDIDFRYGTQNSLLNHLVGPGDE